MNILKITKAKRKWHEIILWWEIRRIPYNIIMYFIGLASFYISYVTIPLVYVVIGLALNFFLTFGWIIELVIQKDLGKTNKMKFAGRSFMGYLVVSTMIVFGFAMIGAR